MVWSSHRYRWGYVCSNCGSNRDSGKRVFVVNAPGEIERKHVPVCIALPYPFNGFVSVFPKGVCVFHSVCVCVCVCLLVSVCVSTCHSVYVCVCVRHNVRVCVLTRHCVCCVSVCL